MEANPLRRALSIANILVAALSVNLALPQIEQTLHIGQGSTDCVTVWQLSMQSETAYPVYYAPGKYSGYWECLDANYQRLEAENAGWNGDNDIQSLFYKPLVDAGVMLRPAQFKGGAQFTCTTDATGNTACDEKVLEIVYAYQYLPATDTSYPEWVLQGTVPLTLHIDDQGLISNIT